ncbi:MAG: hypothetical protein IPK04_18535 [Bdellovibrionales bacterium]|jgi:hypothetical protein|nr:hypothetical protein [Bdellovibrionales bacterium]
MKINNILVAMIVLIPLFSSAGPLTVLLSKEAEILAAKAGKMKLGEEAEKIISSNFKAGVAAKLPHEDLIKVPPFKLDKDVSSSDEFFELFKGNLADSLHVSWQKTSGYTTRMKPVKVKGMSPSTEAERLKYLEDNKIPKEYWDDIRLVDGSLKEDIQRIPNRWLAANNKAENDKAAEVAATLLREYIKRGGKTDPESLKIFMQKASDLVHLQWMHRRMQDPGWASYTPPDQVAPFAQLSRENAQKDIDIMDQAFQHYAKSQEEFVAGQIKKMDETVKKLNAKGDTHQADSLERTKELYIAKLEAIKAQNRMLQYKPAAAPATGPAAAVR